MNFQDLADKFHSPTCIISVERKSDGGYGEIRLVAGNKSYLEPIEHPVFTSDPSILGIPDVFQSNNKFISNSLYEKYLPKDTGFEDICYRAAVKKIPIHTYVHLNDMNIWFDIFALPIEYEEGNICYCLYTAQPSNSDEVGISSSQSDTVSSDIIKCCVKLHSTNDINKTMDEIISDIRLICRADVCTIMLREQTTGLFTECCTSVDKNSRVKRVTQFKNIAEITDTWLAMVSGSDCLIIKDEKDKDFIRNINYEWYDNLDKANVDSFIMFPLRYDNDVLGLIWSTNFDTTNTMRIKETLELITFFISSKLASYKMVEHLKNISYTDQLKTVSLSAPLALNWNFMNDSDGDLWFLELRYHLGLTKMNKDVMLRSLKAQKDYIKLPQLKIFYILKDY